MGVEVEEVDGEKLLSDGTCACARMCNQVWIKDKKIDQARSQFQTKTNSLHACEFSTIAAVSFCYTHMHTCFMPQSRI